MKNKTLRVIIILVGLLVLNIEAAHAGITHKFKALISQELTNFQLLYVGGGLLTIGLLSYIIFMPAFKQGHGNSLAATYLENYTRQNYRVRRTRVKKIAHILKNTEPGEQVPS